MHNLKNIDLALRRNKVIVITVYRREEKRFSNREFAQSKNNLSSRPTNKILTCMTI